MWSSDESDNDDAVRGDAYRDLVRNFGSWMDEDSEQRMAATPMKYARGTPALSQPSASELGPPPEVDWMKDWLEARVWQFFRAIEGFHLGDLDLTGRSSTRYEKLKRRWDAYLDDFELLAPYISEAEVDGPHFDVSAQEWVDEVYKTKIVTNEEVWDAFCTKWKLSPPIPYGDLAALTEHARWIVANNPEPKFQKASLADMPPEIIHTIFSHLAGQYKDGHNLAATSKFFHEIGFDYVFEFRNVVLGADDLYHNIDADTMEEADAQVQAKMTVDRGILLDHITFLASRPDICRRIRTLRVANNWGNTALIGTADICLVQLDDIDMFGPVLRALGDLLPRLSLTQLDLEFLPLDEGLIIAICTQESLVEANLKGCMIPWAAQLFCRSAQLNIRPTRPPQSNIQYLSLTGLLVPPSSIWDFLGLCPHLRSLQAIAGTPDGFLLPSIHQLGRSLPATAISSLERLEFHGLDQLGVTTLTDWLQFAAAQDHSSRLHHLKLVSPSTSRIVNCIEWLLRALHTIDAPLRTLMLDGLPVEARDSADPASVLELVAHLFPDLEGLAVACRATGSRDSRPCAWPRPTHEYAAPLRALTRLRCFGANFDIKRAGAVSPNLGRVFESESGADSSDGDDGGLGGTGSEDGGSASDLPEDASEHVDWEEDADSEVDNADELTQALAPPFAAACPSLRYFVVSGVHSLPQYSCEIARTATGAMNMEDTIPCAPEDTPDVVRLYNPLGLLRVE